MGTNGDGLSKPLSQSAGSARAAPMAVIYIRDYQNGQEFVGLRLPGDHAYRYEAVPPSEPADSEPS